jgi:hypothetical protein
MMVSTSHHAPRLARHPKSVALGCVPGARMRLRRACDGLRAMRRKPGARPRRKAVARIAAPTTRARE